MGQIIAQEDELHQEESVHQYSYPAQELDGVKHTFLSEVLDTVVLNDIPPELIFNWDQTDINLAPSPLWTLDKKGKKRIDVAGHQDKRQITAVMCGSLVGELLPFQLVYGGKTNRCHPTYKFPLYWQIVHTENHWSNKQTIIKYIGDIIVPFVNRKREELDLEDDHAALTIFDHFKGKLTDKIRKCLEHNHIHSVLIPAAYTGKLQPMDVSVNKVVKSFLRSKFSEWYSDELTELFLEDDDEPVDLSTARMKCVSGKWIVQLYEHLEDNPHIVVHGFRHAGIYDALSLIDEDDNLPEYPTSDDSDDENEESDTDIDTLEENTCKRLLSVSDVFSSDSQSEEDTAGGMTSDGVIVIDSDTDT